MEELKSLTEDELLLIPAQTEVRLEAFIKSPKLNTRELISLSRQILRDMGRPNNVIQDLIMMQSLKQLRKNELKEVHNG